nr:ABC transporter B family member 11-like [Ipomoea batatas]
MTIEAGKNWVPFYKLFSYADFTDKILMGIGTVGSIASGVCEIMVVVFFGELIDAFGHNKDTNNVVPAVSKVSLKFVYAAFAMGASSFFQVACWIVTGDRQAARIRNLYLTSILRQDIGFFDKEISTGETTANMSGDIVVLQNAMGEKVGKFIKLVAEFVAGFVVALVRGWHLALVMLSALPPVGLSLVITFIFMAKAASRAQSAYTRAANVVEQTVSSIKMVASFTGENKAVASYKASLAKAYKSEVYQYLAQGLGIGTFTFILFSSFSLSFWYGGRLVLEKGYTGGEVINVTLAVLFGSMALGKASDCMAAFAAGQAAMFKMFEIINRNPEVDANEIDGRVLDDIRGEIELRDVCFSYPTRPKDQILNGFSVLVPSGKTLALVGHSGSGKSTVISLIERFYDPQSGEILIDGVNIKMFKLKWLRQQIGLVSQEPVLFTTTIKENIAYGKDCATMEEIKVAAELANAYKFIKDLPQGLDTMVGERGTQLSGGQKQRIAIARAILKEPRILLLDEATSALDAESERAVQEALEKVMVNRTTVIVAHRLSTIRKADIIAVVHQGQIAEKGTHSQLLKNPEGAYSRLLHLQEANKAEELQGGEDMTAESNIVLEKWSSGSMSIEVADNYPSRHGISSNKTPEKAADVSLCRFASLSKPELPTLAAAATSALIYGAILPVFGLLFANMIQTYYLPPNKMKKDSAFWALMLVVLGAVSLLSILITACLFGVARGKLINRIASMCFEKVVHTEIGWFDEPQNASGVLAAKLSSDAATIRTLISDALLQMIQNLVSCIIGFVIAFRASWQLSLFSFIMFPLIGANIYVEAKHTKGFSTDTKMLYEDATQVANDAVGNMRTVASFCAEEKVMQLYNTKCEKPKKRGLRRGLITGMGFGLTCTSIFFVHASISYFGAHLVAHGKATFEDYFRVYYAMYFTTSVLSQSSSFTQDFRKAKAVAKSIFGLLDRQSKMDLDEKSGLELDSVQGEIEFQSVCYAYPTRPDVKVLYGFSFTVQNGKTVALVGKSGSGKSTVIALLQRFYDCDSGRIMLDGVDIRNLNLKWLRKQMGLVSQEPVLLNDTIRANITYGKDEDVTEGEVIAAAELANAHKFISGLQQGYDTVVGERGVQLSGGQKQRVAIARAIMKSPRILLLDEATSALDAESERMVQDALDKIMVNRTTIMIAHRLSTVRGADVIAVVKDGAVVEKGKHDMLIAKRDGHYASLVALQTCPSSEPSAADVYSL